MANSAETARPAPSNRRTLLKRIALGLAALGAYAALNRRPIATVKRGRRSIPANLPGEGSIFRPRNDRRPFGP